MSPYGKGLKLVGTTFLGSERSGLSRGSGIHHYF